MNIVQKIFNFLIYKTEYYLLSVLNYIIPKSPKSVFISDRRYRKDNVWAIANYLSSNVKYEKYQIYYYTKKCIAPIGNITVISNSLYALWKQLRSKYIFYSYRDVKQFKPVRNQIIIDTMHGSPLKRIGYLAGNSKFKKLWKFENTFSYILCNSDFFKNIIQKSFGAKEEQCLVLGYPKNDWIFTKNDFFE